MTKTAFVQMLVAKPSKSVATDTRVVTCELSDEICSISGSLMGYVTMVRPMYRGCMVAPAGKDDEFLG
ncbi:hypothetical protein NML43_06385 [Rhodopseudomonas palustris]|uniref:hypothetical protein n=1 Tax=Rhodopseudomonas palustris TaxID=1076 RepID=UPI0020CD7BD2|nr:hypothetical protein [Rhodopseudomonas palustris]MCP9626709.1 hypothetical protein [Rhodopseudomonas palustris]